MVLNGLVPSIGHLVAARCGREPVPLAPLVSHTALGKEDHHIAGHVLYTVGGHTQPAFEGHQQRPCIITKHNMLNSPVQKLCLSAMMCMPILHDTAHYTMPKGCCYRITPQSAHTKDCIKAVLQWQGCCVRADYISFGIVT